MAQPPQFPPQEDLPFFLQRIIWAIIKAIIKISTAITMIVAAFSTIHANMINHSLFVLEKADNDFYSQYEEAHQTKKNDNIGFSEGNVGFHNL